MRTILFAVPLASLLSVGMPAAAQSIDGRFGLGVEVPALDIRHVNRDVSVPDGTADESTTISVGQTSTAMGLFALGAGLNGQYGLTDQTALGMRVALRRETSKSDGGSTAAHSQLSILPRFEYFMSPDQTVRPHVGLEAGFERSTSNGAAGFTSNLWLIGPTGGVSYFPSSNWSVDVNASLLLLTGSEDVAGQAASTGGYAGLLRVTLSSWFGSTPSGNITTTPASVPSTSAPVASDASVTPKVFSGYRGIVQRELSIAPGLTLTLTTHPITSSDVRYNLTMEADASAFAGCEELGIDFAGNTIRATQLQRRSRPGGFTAEDSITGTLPGETLDAASSAKGDSALVVCQRRWPLTAVHLERLRGLKVASDMIANGQGLVAGDTASIEMNDESVVTELLLSREVSWRLEWKPLLSAHAVTAGLFVRGQSDMSSGCKELSIQIDGSTLPVEGVYASRFARPDGVAQMLEGELTLVTLAQIAAGTGEEVVDACGFKATISPTNREQTWAFIARSVALARRLGTWRGFRPPAVTDQHQKETKPGQSEAPKHKKK